MFDYQRVVGALIHLQNRQRCAENMFIFCGHSLNLGLRINYLRGIEVMRLAKFSALRICRFLNMAWIDGWWTVGIWAILQSDHIRRYMAHKWNNGWSIPTPHIAMQDPDFELGDSRLANRVELFTVVPGFQGFQSDVRRNTSCWHDTIGFGTLRLLRESIWQHYFGASEASQGSRMGSSCYKQCEGAQSQKLRQGSQLAMTLLFFTGLNGLKLPTS
jgi:hypothetical protein